MIGWLAWLRELTPDRPTALVSILASEGSVPRGAGTRMVVTGDVLRGTIGGGQLEHRAVEQARAILALSPGTWRIQDYPLGPLLGQCCGGRVRVLIEHVDQKRLDWIQEPSGRQLLVTMLGAGRVDRSFDAIVPPTRLSARGERPCDGAVFVETIDAYCRPLYIFGAGHVGQAVAHHAENLPFRLAWFDTRDSFGSIDRVVVMPEVAIETCVSKAPPDAAMLILTHDHALDYRLTLAALRREATAFVGLIGSATKRARFERRLHSDGLSGEQRAQLKSPIGIAGIIGKEPDVIAVATLAQLLQLPGPA